MVRAGALTNLLLLSSIAARRSNTRAFTTSKFIVHQSLLKNNNLFTTLLLRGGGNNRGILSAASSDNTEEPKTGWLHNTEPKYYTPDESTITSPAMKRLLIEKMKDYRNHRIINPPAFHPCGDNNKRMVVTEHKIAVPLYHADLEQASTSIADSIKPIDSVDSGYNTNESFDKPTIDIYFTITELVTNSEDEAFFQSLANTDVTPKQRADMYLQRDGSSIDASRMILYLQGGPGFGCSAPVSGLSLSSSKASWAASVLCGDITNLDGKAFERIVLMDQRGTGKSSPITKQRLKKQFPDLFLLDDCEESKDSESAEMQLKRAKVVKATTDATDYLSTFRSDSIVRDAEWIKGALTQTTNPMLEEVKMPQPQPWGAALGQSFGGFCLMTYLSSILNPPAMTLFTGGIAPMNTPVSQVYDRLWLRVKDRNLLYYEKYPGDVQIVKRIVQHLLSQDDSNPIKLPSGGTLTARRFLQLGLALGGSPGSSFANLHAIINSAFLDDDYDDNELSTAFLKRIDYEQSFDDAPLYFLLHESIYADGPSSGATNWAAHSSYEQYVSTNPEFDYKITSKSDTELPVLFFGEMVFPWMADDYYELSGYGMKSLSQSIATKSDWLPLFDAFNMRAALGAGNIGMTKSKAASATYYSDMYVDFDCAMKLIKRGEPLENVKVWVTNEYQHSGLRDDGAHIVSKLVQMAKGTINVPS